MPKILCCSDCGSSNISDHGCSTCKQGPTKQCKVKVTKKERKNKKGEIIPAKTERCSHFVCSHHNIGGKCPNHATREEMVELIASLRNSSSSSE